MTRKKLKECLAADRKHMLGNTKLYHIVYIFCTRHPAWLRWKYVKYMRIADYYSGVLMIWYQFLRNRLGNRIDNVRIADDCKIGAGEVVVKDFLEPGSVIGEVPAKKIR